MIILTIRTDKPESEIGLYKDNTELVYEKWTAHRQLAETLHQKIKDLLEAQSLSYDQIDGIVCFLGPGSFTGLRIGVSVANSLAYSLRLPIAGGMGENWIKDALRRLISDKPIKPLVPEYGESVFTTKPKK